MTGERRTYLVAKLLDHSPQRARFETRVLAVLVVGNHGQHHVQVAADKGHWESASVLWPAADYVHEVPYLSPGQCADHKNMTYRQHLKKEQNHMLYQV